MGSHNTKAAQRRLSIVETEKAYQARILKLCEILREQAEGEAPPDVLKWTIGEIEAAARKSRRLEMMNVQQ